MGCGGACRSGAAAPACSSTLNSQSLMSTVSFRSIHLLPGFHDKAAADDDRGYDHADGEPIGGTVQAFYGVIEVFNLQADGELVVGELIKNHISAAGRVFKEVLHVEHPGEDAPGGELARNAFFHHIDHVVTDELDGVEFGREGTNGAVKVEHGLAEEGQRGGYRGAVGLGYACEVEQSRTYSHTSAAHVMVTADESTDVLGEGPAIDILGYLNHIQVGVSYAFAQALREG